MIRPLDDSLYATICGWWKEYDFSAQPPGVLPKRGYVALVSEKPVIACFLYTDPETLLGVFTFFGANPESSDDERSKGFSELCEHVLEEARRIGIKCILTPTNNPSLSTRLTENGFKKADENVIHFYKEI